MTTFVRHTVETAPAAARRAMTTSTQHLGYLPAAVGLLATAPKLLEGFLSGSALFETTTLDAESRETLILTVAVRNECHLCAALHSARWTALGADPAVLAALRDRRTLPDPRLEAMRRFVGTVLDTAGQVGEPALAAFFSAGYTPEQALESVLGIGIYTMSTLANRLTAAPVDDQLAAFA